MAEIWKPQPSEVYQSWINAIRDEASDGLSTWETEFLDSIELRVVANGSLSERQAKVLERIYTEKTK